MNKRESDQNGMLSGDSAGSKKDRPEYSLIKEVLAGLTVSFVAISLGAAFGVMSGRGALAGILSAGVIALITAAIGGTRIQCSGPTAPMTTVTAAVIASIGAGLLASNPDINIDHFLNIVLILTGLILFLAAVFRLGKFINLVPKVVISGFMNGIAVLIWIGEAKTLLGLKPKLDPETGKKLMDESGEVIPRILDGGVGLNVVIALITLVLCFAVPPMLRKINPKLSSFLPSTLVVIVLMSVVVIVAKIGVEKVALGGSLGSFEDLTSLVKRQWPTEWSWGIVWLALPFAGQLALLAYLDTLLTSLVVDKKVQTMFGINEKTAQNKELVAQGIANAAVAPFGGIPGAQATIRSVLILNEGAMTRLAGILVGVFVLVEMVLLQNLITAIPIAVFSGVLIKVGYDVFDWEPLKIYVRELRQKSVPTAADEKKMAGRPMVTHLNMFFIAGTTLVTVLVNLNVAVIAFCILFYVLKAMMPVHDLMEATETEGFIDEG